MHICYYIIQIVFTLVGSIGLFAFMFFNNANLEEVLSDGIVTYLIFKNSFSLVALLLYNAIVTIVSICILWLISKISKKGSVSIRIMNFRVFLQSNVSFFWTKREIALCSCSALQDVW